MARPLEELEDEIRSLSPEAQERLLRVLLERLDGPPHSGAAAAWSKEIRRRKRELDTGTVKAVPAKEVFARLRERLKERR